MRVFDGDDGRPNHRSVADVKGGVTRSSRSSRCMAILRKGRRPSFDEAARPDIARGLYEDLVRELRATGIPVETGEFQADMRVEIAGDGPVTLILDSKGQR